LQSGPGASSSHLLPLANVLLAPGPEGPANPLGRANAGEEKRHYKRRIEAQIREVFDGSEAPGTPEAP